MQLQVRRLASRDHDRWRALFRAYIDFYEAVVPESVIEQTWRSLVEDANSDLVGLVAVDAANTPVGLAHLLFHASTWSPTCYCYLEDLFVDPDYRGEGAGAALIAAAYAAADARGATRTYWVTRQDNSAARSLYDRVARLSPFVQYRR